MSIMWNGSLTPWLDANGAPYSGLQAYFFDANTSTPRVVFADAGGAQPHDHPVVANAGGMFAPIFLPAGDFRLRIETATGVTVWDVDGISTPSAGDDGGGGGGDTDPTLLLQTGMLTDRYGVGAMSGWVRAAGRTIGNAASAATERANADCSALFLYLWTEDATLAVSGGRGATAAGDFAAGKRIDLPDFRLRARVGLAGMGNATSTIIADAMIDGGETTTTLGATFGTSTVTLLGTQMPIHNHGGGTGTAGAHVHPVTFGSAQAAGLAPGAAASTGVNLGASTINTAAAGDHSHTINSEGGGLAHPNLQPSSLITVYLKL